MDLKSKKIVKFFLKLTVSSFLVAWLIVSQDWREVGSVISGVSVSVIALYLAVFISGVIISSYKWKILSEYKGIRKNLPDFFKLYLGGIFINNFMPSFVGGDTFKAYQAGKENGKFKESASAVVADRLTGLWGAIILALLFGALNWEKVAGSLVLSVAFMVTAGAFMVTIIFLLVRRMEIWKKLFGFLPKKASEFFSVLSGFADSDILTKALSLSLVFSFVGLALANYILFSAFGAKIDILDYLSVIFLISIVSSIPVSINNIGVKEWAYVTFFGIFGLASSLVVAVAILSRFLQMAVSFAALPVYLKSRDRKQRDGIKRAVKY